MKKIYIILMFVALMAMPGMAQASPFYLTLEGSVQRIEDAGNLAASANIGVGAKVKYVIKFDTDRKGVNTNWSGNQVGVQGTIYSALQNGVLNGKTFQGDRWANTYDSGFYGQAGNDKSLVYMNDWNTSLTDLTVGSKINQFSEFSSNKWGQRTRLVINNITVTGISNVAPTPIPAAAFIMMGGLGLVGFIKRRFA